MRKSLLSFAAVMFFVFAICGSHVSAEAQSRAKEVYGKLTNEDAPLKQIAIINDPDLADVSAKVKELLLREGMEPVIEGSETHIVSVEKDKAEKAVALIRNDEFLRSKQIRIHWDYLQDRLVNIGLVLGPDHPDVATKLYEFLLREGIGSIIEGSVVYGVQVDKDHAEKAVALILNDEYWGNSKQIAIDLKYAPGYIKRHLATIAYIRDPDFDGVSKKVQELLLREDMEPLLQDFFGISVEEDKAEKAVALIRNDEFLKYKQIYIKPEYVKKMILTVTISQVGFDSQQRHLLKEWLIQAKVNKSDNPEVVPENTRIHFLVHSPIKSFRTREIQGKMFDIEFDEPLNVNEVYSGGIKVKAHEK